MLELIVNNKGLFPLLTVQENSRKCRGLTLFTSILTTFLSRGDVVLYLDLECTTSRINGEPPIGRHLVFGSPQFRAFVERQVGDNKLRVVDGNQIFGEEVDEEISPPLGNEETGNDKWNMDAIFKEGPLMHTFFPQLPRRLASLLGSGQNYSEPPDSIEDLSHGDTCKVDSELEEALQDYDDIFINCFELLLIEDMCATISFLRSLLMRKKKRSIVILVDSAMLDHFAVSQLNQMSPAIILPTHLDIVDDGPLAYIEMACWLYYNRQGKKPGKVNESFKIQLNREGSNPLPITDIKQVAATDTGHTKDTHEAATSKKAPQIKGSADDDDLLTQALQMSRLQKRVPFSLKATHVENEEKLKNLVLPHKVKIILEEDNVAQYFPINQNLTSARLGRAGSEVPEIYEVDDEFEDLDPDDDLDV